VSEFTDISERNAHTYSDADVGKVVKVLSPLGYYLVLSQSGGVGTFGQLAVGSSGDVVGPGSATDNAVARFDGTTGKLIQNSPVSVSDSGDISGAGTINGVSISTHGSRHNPGGVDAVSTASPSGTAVQVGNTASEGTATTLARSDHSHTVTGDTPVSVTKSANAAGSAVTFARSDHKHDASTASPSTIGTSNSEGTATSLARSDHIHNHGNQNGGSLHAAATTSVNGFMSASDKTKLDGLSNSYPRYLFGGCDFSTVNNSDWAVNNTAALAADSNNSALDVILFDDTVEEGVGMEFYIPTGVTNIVFHVVHRAETAPGSPQVAQAAVYGRNFPDNAAVTSWSSAVDLGSGFAVPSNENWQYDSQSVALSSLGLAAGLMNQVEFTRQGTDGDDTLSGDWAVLSVRLEFS
jgi:hypothetical protein